MKENKITFNPYSNPLSPEKSSPLDQLCLLKAAMSATAGGGFGLIMSAFMTGVEMRDHSLVGKRSTKQVLRKDWKRMVSSGKGFAIFGGLFVLFECMLEKVRIKEDGVNSFTAGFLTSVALAADVMRGKELLYSGMGGGVMCYLFYKVFKMMGY